MIADYDAAIIRDMKEENIEREILNTSLVNGYFMTMVYIQSCATTEQF